MVEKDLACIRWIRMVDKVEKDGGWVEKDGG